MLTQSPAQSLTEGQTKPDPGKTRDDKVVIIVIPRPAIVPADVRFVIGSDGAFIDLNGIRIPMPGGGASGCFGEAAKKPDLAKPDPSKPDTPKPDAANPDPSKKP